MNRRAILSCEPLEARLCLAVFSATGLIEGKTSVSVGGVSDNDQGSLLAASIKADSYNPLPYSYVSTFNNSGSASAAIDLTNVSRAYDPNEVLGAFAAISDLYGGSPITGSSQVTGDLTYTILPSTSVYLGEKMGDSILVTVYAYHSYDTQNGIEAGASVTVNTGGGAVPVSLGSPDQGPGSYQFLTTIGASFSLSFEEHESATNAPHAGGPHTGPSRLTVQLFGQSASYDLVATPNGLNWNIDRGGGSGSNSKRGVDLNYEVIGGSLPEPPEVAFYWANATGSPIGDRLPLDPETVLAGLYGPYQVNEPARWGPAPPDARSIVAILDPDNKIFETDETNNVVYLPIHTTAELLDNSVVATVVGPDIRFVFRPGSGIGQALTLSEAEVVTGVDHFNWDQTVRPPGNFRTELWQDIQGADGSVNEEDFDPIKHIFVGRSPRAGQPILRIPLPQGYSPDPVVQDVPGHVWTKVFVIDDDGRNDVANIYVPIISDGSPFYFNEPDEWRDFNFGNGGTASATEFTMFDQPKLVASSTSLLDPTKQVQTYQGSNYFVAFVTQLVGVISDRSFVRLGRPGIGYSWKSNAVIDSNGISGGVRYPKAIAVLKAPIDLDVSPYGGGVFELRRDDGTLVAGVPVEAPPITLPPDGSTLTPTTIEAITAAGGTAKKPAVTSISITFTGPVTLADGAIELSQKKGKKLKKVGVKWTTSTNADGSTAVTLRFKSFRKGLANGQYVLSIKGASVVDAAGGLLDGDGDGVSGGDRTEMLKIVRGRRK